MARPYIVTENGVNKYLLTVDNICEKIDVNDLPPDKFKFKHHHDNEVMFTAEKISYDKYSISYIEDDGKEESINYWTADVIEYLQDGIWIMI
jgi:hypothetical protein